MIPKCNMGTLTPNALRLNPKKKKKGKEIEVRCLQPADDYEMPDP